MAESDPGASALDEAAFLEGLENWPEDTERLFAVTRALKKAGEKEKPRSLLQRLAATQKELGLPRARLETMLEIARAFPKKASPPEEFASAFQEAYPEHPSIGELAAHYFRPKANVIDAAEKLRRWLPFVPGAAFFFAGHGAGRVVELKPAIDAVRLDFEGGQRLSLPPGAAAKNLIPLPEGDFRRERLENPDALRRACLADPAAGLKHLLVSVGRPMTAAEIKEAFAGLVPAEKWAGFWSAARRNPQLLLAGKGKNAGYSWMESAAAARDSIQEEFDAAAPADKLALARKHSGRRALAPHFVAGLASAASAIAETEPAAALEILLFLEAQFPDAALPLDPDRLLSGPGAAAVAAGVRDPAARIRAYQLLRSAAGDSWPALFAELYRTEEDSRGLAALDAALAERSPSSRREIVSGILRAPRTAPRAFLWLLARRESDADVAPHMDARILAAVLDALRLPEFSSLRARLKALFDRGGLALSLVERIPDAQEARRLLTASDRAAGLESFRRDDFRQAVLRRFPELTGPRIQPIYATGESIRTKRRELEELLTVEIPRNGRAIQEAAAMGDLSENFEYHSARARQEYLTARAAKLREELARARPLDPRSVEPSEIRVGTRVRLTRGEAARELAILGPWESSPENGVYSYESDFARGILGRKAGDPVVIDGEEWRIREIGVWADAIAGRD
jgi:transcription elongation GreA/GreB family factor